MSFTDLIWFYINFKTFEVIVLRLLQRIYYIDYVFKINFKT